MSVEDRSLAPFTRKDGTFALVTGSLADGTFIERVKGPTVVIEGPVREDLRRYVQYKVAVGLAFRRAIDSYWPLAERAQIK